MGAGGGKQQAKEDTRRRKARGAAARLKMGAINLSHRGQIKADRSGDHIHWFVAAAKVVCYAKIKKQNKTKKHYRFLKQL